MAENFVFKQTGAELQAIIDAVETIDQAPTAGSKNPVESGGVAAALEGVETALQGVDDALEAVDTRIDGVDTRIDGVDTALAGKQATLVSGTNIKTINGESVLGSGDLRVGDANAVKNLAGSGSAYTTVIKAGNSDSMTAEVRMVDASAKVQAAGGSVEVNAGGVALQAGNSGAPNAKVTYNGEEVATKKYVDDAIEAIDVTDQIAGKADKVTGAVSGDFAGLDSQGNLTDSGKKASDFATAAQGAKADAAAPQATTYTKGEVDAAFAGKAGKVANAVAGDFAGLDANGNLVDSGKKASDFALQENTYTKAEIGNLITPIDSEVIVGALPASGVANKVYRVPGTDSYTDYGWDGTQFVPLATFNGDLDEKVDKVIVKSSNEVSLTPTKSMLAYIYKTGAIYETTQTRVSYYPVTEGDRIKIIGSFGLNLNTLLYVFLDSSETLVEKGLLNSDGTKGTIVTQEVDVPAGAAYVAIQSATNTMAYPSCYKYEYTYINVEDELRALADLYTPTLNVLCFGNSFTQDTIGYVPWLIKEARPNLEVNIYIAYIGGAPLAQQLASISGQNVVQGETTYTPQNYTVYKYINGASAWTSESNVSAASVLAAMKWDVVTFQQSGTWNWSDWDTYFAPFIYKLQAYVKAALDYEFKFGYIMTHASYSSSASDLVIRYNGIVANATKMENSTPNEVLLPYATALQNARTTYLDKYGAGSHMMADTAHVNDGIACLVCAYSNAMALLDAIGENVTIMGSQIVPDAAWVASHNVPAPSAQNLGLSVYNIYVAQQCAIMARKYPLQITNMVTAGMVGQYEIKFNDGLYTRSNPIESANSGESWTTTITPNTGYQIASVVVTMGNVDITSTAYDNGVVNISSISGDVSITVNLQTA